MAHSAPQDLGGCPEGSLPGHQVPAEDQLRKLPWPLQAQMVALMLPAAVLLAGPGRPRLPVALLLEEWGTDTLLK